jgi:hypothetical protein
MPRKPTKPPPQAIIDAQYVEPLALYKIQSRHNYHDLSDNEAKILFAILRLQHTESGATQKGLENIMGVDQGQISGLLTPLVDGGYVIIGKVSTGFGGSGPKQIYELQARTAITCRDTALFLLELLQSEPEYAFNEQIIDLRRFLPALSDSQKLHYLTIDDFRGTATYPGKIAELAIAGEYIERVGEHYIRPRIRLLLERKFLLLVIECPALKDLSSFVFDSEQKQWVREDQIDDHLSLGPIREDRI